MGRPTQLVSQNKTKVKHWGWGHGSRLKSTFCSCRGPRLKSQHLHVSSKLSLALVLGHAFLYVHVTDVKHWYISDRQTDRQTDQAMSGQAWRGHPTLETIRDFVLTLPVFTSQRGVLSAHTCLLHPWNSSQPGNGNAEMTKPGSCPHPPFLWLWAAH